MKLVLATIAALLGSLAITVSADAAPATRACGSAFAFASTPAEQGHVWVRGPVTCRFAIRVVETADDKIDRTHRTIAVVTVWGRTMRCEILMDSENRQPIGWTDENYPIMYCTGAGGRRVGLYA